jgi:hypothetical protein
MDGISARLLITTRRQKDHVTVALQPIPSKGEAWDRPEYLFFTLPGGLGHSVLEQLLYDLGECERACSQDKSPEPLF